jgi:hypothetical protein
VQSRFSDLRPRLYVTWRAPAQAEERRTVINSSSQLQTSWSADANLQYSETVPVCLTAQCWHTTHTTGSGLAGSTRDCRPVMYRGRQRWALIRRIIKSRPNCSCRIFCRTRNKSCHEIGYIFLMCVFKKTLYLFIIIITCYSLKISYLLWLCVTCMLYYHRIFFYFA